MGVLNVHKLTEDVLYTATAFLFRSTLKLAYFLIVHILPTLKTKRWEFLNQCYSEAMKLPLHCDMCLKDKRSDYEKSDFSKKMLQIPAVRTFSEAFHDAL